MSYRIAEALDQLRDQVDAAYPNRSKVSDGWIGDTAHSTRTSDHNPWVEPPHGGVVTAIDLTDDPDSGADMDAIAEALRRSKDPRIKYVIWDGRMFSSYATTTHAAWTWRPYTGSNLHTRHMHVSVQPTRDLYDSRRAWALPQRKEWFEMATKRELREVIDAANKASEARIDKMLAEHRRLLAVGKAQKSYNPDNVNLKKVMEVAK